MFDQSCYLTYSVLSYVVVELKDIISEREKKSFYWLDEIPVDLVLLFLISINLVQKVSKFLC